MTYRELLKLYQEGKLDKAQTDEVEHAIEKQEAISEYLYEKRRFRDSKYFKGRRKKRFLCRAMMQNPKRNSVL